METSQLLVAILASSGFTAIASALVAGLFSKRKMGAEATEIITKAAASVVTNLEAEISRQKHLNDELVAEHRRDMAEERRRGQDAIAALMVSHAEEIEEFRRVLQLHVSWDAIAIAKLAELDVKLPPAPPLLPARRFDHPTSTLDS